MGQEVTAIGAWETATAEVMEATLPETTTGSCSTLLLMTASVFSALFAWAQADAGQMQQFGWQSGDGLHEGRQTPEPA